jgi:nucleotide-binding universal stress UspA family protein
VKFWASIFKPEQIEIVNVRMKNQDLEELDKELYYELIDKERQEDQKWEKEINEAFKGVEFDVHVRMHYGNSLLELKTISLKENYDLVICGKKQSILSSNQLSENLAKEIEASFLLIPETAIPQCKKILVPTDCSVHASLALKTAQKIKESQPETQLSVLRVYEVPTGYHYIGHSFEEAAHNMGKVAEKKVQDQLKKLDMEVDDIHIELKKEHSNAEHIQANAATNRADLIITGSKGITASAHMLLGTTASKMIHNIGRAPILIIKKKGETLDFLGALSKLINPE